MAKPSDSPFMIGNLLACPKCGEEYLHHDAVIVRFRIAEDRPGVEYHVGRQAFAGMAIEDGFYGRRDDLEVIFWCEFCSMSDANPPEIDPAKRFKLRIIQHKGLTRVEWAPHDF